MGYLALLPQHRLDKLRALQAEKQMPSCPKCQNENYRKDGFMKGKQHYHCKTCGYRHTVANRGYSEETKRKALQLYLVGL